MQRRFQFTLEPVRMLRRNAERAALKSLADELGRSATIERALTLAEARLNAAHDDGIPVSTAAEIVGRQCYVERIERVVEELRQGVARQALLVEAARRDVADAMREREALDRLEDRRRGAHAAEGRRLDRVAADEIALSAHRRAGEMAA
jgi:flagellar export protein FliJ